MFEEKKKIQKLELRDRSCTPGAWLCEAIGHQRHPFEDDQFILDSWNPAHTLARLIVHA